MKKKLNKDTEIKFKINCPYCNEIYKISIKNENDFKIIDNCNCCFKSLKTTRWDFYIKNNVFLPIGLYPEYYELCAYKDFLSYGSPFIQGLDTCYKRLEKENIFTDTIHYNNIIKV